MNMFYKNFFISFVLRVFYSIIILYFFLAITSQSSIIKCEKSKKSDDNIATTKCLKSQKNAKNSINFEKLDNYQQI